MIIKEGNNLIFGPSRNKKQKTNNNNNPYLTISYHGNDWSKLQIINCLGILAELIASALAGAARPGYANLVMRDT